MAMRYYAPFPGGGPPARARGPHALRIGDAERDAAAADLGEHYAAGRLTLDELNERLDEVFTAKTLGQLTRTMADLPGLRRLPRPGWPSGQAACWGAVSWVPGGIPAAAGTPWAGLAPRPGLASGGRPARPTAADRAGRLAALSLLLLAMLIWLFTAMLFARHGGYQQVQIPHIPAGLPGPGGPR